MQVQIVNKSNHRLPEYAHPGDAGMDLKANLDEPITLRPMSRTLIPTGLYIGLPDECEAQVRSRSGWALKQGVIVLNAPGTVDSNYRGEVGVILINLGENPVTIYPGDRIAQLVVAKYETIEWNEVRELDSTERGEGGFGSSGR